MEEYIQKIKAKFSMRDIEELFHKLQPLKVMVIGDIIIDEYCFVYPKGRAIKDPMLSTEFKYEEVYAGGILAVANHLSSFVSSIKLVTLIGDRENRLDFVQKSLASNVQLNSFTKKDSPTIVKRRYIDSHRNNKLFKVEYINDHPIEEELSIEIVNFLNQDMPNYDLVVVCDFGHGFINEAIRRKIEEKAKFLALNVQTNSANSGYNQFTLYHKFDLITLNEDELRTPVNRRFEDSSQILLDVHKKTGQSMLLTKGKAGNIYASGGKLISAPALINSVKDVVGAGDALFSMASLIAYLKVGDELVPFMGNCAGAIAANIMGNKESINKEKMVSFIGNVYKIEITKYLNSVNDTLSNMSIENIDAFTSLLMEAYNNDKTIYIFGNGGSAATASHFCGDLIKGVSYGLNKRFRAICLNDNMPTLMAIANDISYDDIFVEQLKNFLNKDDLVIGISGSGNSINIVKAMEYANQAGAKTVAICGYKGGKIKDISHLAIHASVNDMEVSEDIHQLILTHCVKRIITKELNNTNLGDEYVKRVG